jgi:hypothetical protein
LIKAPKIYDVGKTACPLPKVQGMMIPISHHTKLLFKNMFLREVLGSQKN